MPPTLSRVVAVARVGCHVVAVTPLSAGLTDRQTD